MVTPKSLVTLNLPVTEPPATKGNKSETIITNVKSSFIYSNGLGREWPLYLNSLFSHMGRLKHNKL